MRRSHLSGLRGALAHDPHELSVPAPANASQQPAPGREQEAPGTPSPTLASARFRPMSQTNGASGRLPENKILQKLLRIGRIEDSYLRPVRGNKQQGPLGGSSNGRTQDSDSCYLGSNPSPPAMFTAVSGASPRTRTGPIV